jgi:hypothetical protein
MGFSQCGSATSTWIREILPTGWGDTYFQGVPGQSFDITDLPNGTYWIEVHANPEGRLFDGDPTNDVELREVILPRAAGIANGRGSAVARDRYGRVLRVRSLSSRRSA